MNTLLSGLSEKEMFSMSLGLAHSMSRYKLKFSTDKVDTMIIQAVSLLEDLDKELNNYAMRIREWYGWHFPEVSKIVSDNLAYAKVINVIGMRKNITSVELSEFIPEDIEE
jgi:nucleolar protein 58